MDGGGGISIMPFITVLCLVDWGGGPQFAVIRCLWERVAGDCRECGGAAANEGSSVEWGGGVGSSAYRTDV